MTAPEIKCEWCGKRYRHVTVAGKPPRQWMVEKIGFLGIEVVRYYCPDHHRTPEQQAAMQEGLQ